MHLNFVLQTDSTDSLQYLDEAKSDYFGFNMHEAIVIFPSSDFPISPPIQNRVCNSFEKFGLLLKEAYIFQGIHIYILILS